MERLSAIFKAYDVRGIYPDQLDEKDSKRIGEAFASILKPKKVAVGRDVRVSGESMKSSLIEGLVKSGVDVVDIGTITTDQLYFAVGNYGFDAGISVTASHNPKEYNGFKFSEAAGGPITSKHLIEIRDWAASDASFKAPQQGKVSTKDITIDYIQHVVGYIDKSKIRPLRILANANFGAVGHSLDLIASQLGLKLERLNWKEDGTFPKGPPNPLLPENRDETISRINKIKPDFGVAWDADADRVFFFDEEGTFIPSPFIIALLSEQMLQQNPGATIVHDLTTAWVIDDTVVKHGGQSIANRTGHTFMKARMRSEDAVFAGESSGHYYFRDSFYADNGIVPFLMILEMVGKSGKSLGDLVKPLMNTYKVSGEINFEVKNPSEAIKLIENKFGKEGKIDKTDGLVVTSKQWRFSVRPSNTEPLFRLNAESLSQQVLDDLVAEITATINT